MSVSGVWKRYGRSHQVIRRRGLTAIWAEVRGSVNTDASLREHEFWALRDVSIEIGAGQALGVIGLNGAGKSTLLRVMAGLSKPDLGTVAVSGSLTALLDFGGGFDDLLTGRENVLASPLLHRIHSDRRGEVLDRVLEFAGIGEFVDVPLRHYSKGMRMRLAFATAVSTEADTILIDEVVAVGDVAFQRKCISHLQKFVKSGGSLVAVAHSPWLLESICDRGLLLSEGLASVDGPIEDVTAAYAEALVDSESSPGGGTRTAIFTTSTSGDASGVTEEGEARNAAGKPASEDRTGSTETPRLSSPKCDRPVGFRSIELSGPEGGAVTSGDTMRVRLTCDSEHAVAHVDYGVILLTGEGLLPVAGQIVQGGPWSMTEGINSFEFEIVDLPLVPGSWAAQVALLDSATGVVLGMHGFDVSPLAFEITGPPIPYSHRRNRRSGPLLRPWSCSWSAEVIDE